MMNSSTALPRRQFLAQTARAGAALAFAPRLSAADEAPAAGRFPLIVFNKPFQKLNFDDTADVIAEVGWSGLECPVRAGGQILPENVEDELPRLVEALKKRGLTFEILTSDILAVNPRAEKVLRTAAKLGIRRFRLGFQYYDLAKPIAAQLAEIKPAMRDLAALCKDLGLRGGIQNHSGARYVGAPVWDVHELLHDIAPEHLGICFDIGHATLEGGTAWPLNARLVEPMLTAVYVKDFAWQKGDKGFTAKWGPLGEGMVRREFFAWLKTTAYRGPISQHVEYQEGVGPEQTAAMKRDFATLKSWLAA